MSKAKKLEKMQEEKNTREAMIYQATVFILDKLRALMTGKNGESFGRVKLMDSVFYSIYGERKFATRLCYANTDREIAMILDGFGAGKLLHMMNTPMIYYAIDDLMEVQKEMKKLEKLKKKFDNKSIVTPRAKIEKYKKLSNKYNDGIKKIRKLYDIHRSTDSNFEFSGLNEFLKAGKKKNKFDNSDFVKKYKRSFADVNNYKNLSFKDDRVDGALVSMLHGREEDQNMNNVYAYPNRTNLPYNSIPYDSAFGRQLQLSGMDDYINGNNISRQVELLLDNNDEEEDESQYPSRASLREKRRKQKIDREDEYCTVNDVKGIISEVIKEVTKKDKEEVQSQNMSMQDMYTQLRGDMQEMIRAETKKDTRDDMSVQDMYQRLKRDMEYNFDRERRRTRYEDYNDYRRDEPIRRNSREMNSAADGDNRYNFIIDQMSQLQNTVNMLANTVANSNLKNEDDDEDELKEKIKKKDKKKKKQKKRLDDEAIQNNGFDENSGWSLTKKTKDTEDDEEDSDEDDDEEDKDKDLILDREDDYLYSFQSLLTEIEKRRFSKNQALDLVERLYLALYKDTIISNKYATKGMVNLAETILDTMCRVIDRIYSNYPILETKSLIQDLEHMMQVMYDNMVDNYDELSKGLLNIKKNKKPVEKKAKSDKKKKKPKKKAKYQEPVVPYQDNDDDGNWEPLPDGYTLDDILWDVNKNNPEYYRLNNLSVPTELREKDSVNMHDPRRMNNNRETDQQNTDDGDPARQEKLVVPLAKPNSKSPVADFNNTHGG